MAFPKSLADIIRQHSHQKVFPAVKALADRLLDRYGDPAAILFYGSCMRAGDDRGGMVDLYVLVDDYRSVYPARLWASLNKLLPPNVFYLEVPFEGRRVRAKYAVLSLEDFEKGTSMDWFHSYLWGRFAQPSAFAHCRDPETADRVIVAMGQAVITFIQRAIPCTKTPFTPQDLWFKGLSLSYRSELRTEKPEKLARLVAAYAEYYDAVTQAAMPAISGSVEPVAGESGTVYHARIPARTRSFYRQVWRVRFLQGKVLSALRLLKGAFTFSGGVDYIQWKIERHTGVRVELGPKLKNRPILAAMVLAYKIYRRGGFR
ncbi:MAG: hypothetical protein PVF20_09055 [Desulfobacterales bacterium]|jgi:hypothetical protein